MCKKNQPQVSKEEPFLFEDVLRDELRLIKERRKVLFPRIVNEDSSPIGETDTPGTSLAGAPATGKKDSDKEVNKQREEALMEHLAGLAFSGGGIRSASFAIGVLQGLASLTLLNWFDYLSTVSGGGFAGGWLAAWLKREGDPINVEKQLDVSRNRQSKADRHFAENRDDVPPKWIQLPYKYVLDEEPEPVTHLRDYSSYLTPRGGLFSTDTWALLAIYLRNVFINLLVLLPLLFSLVLIVRFIIQCYVCSLSPTVRHEGSHGEICFCGVFIAWLPGGLIGLIYILVRAIRRLITTLIWLFLYVLVLIPVVVAFYYFDGEPRLFFVYIAGLLLGFLGLLFNAIAIGVPRSSPTISLWVRRNLFSACGLASAGRGGAGCTILRGGAKPYPKVGGGEPALGPLVGLPLVVVDPHPIGVDPHLLWAEKSLPRRGTLQRLLPVPELSFSARPAVRGRYRVGLPF
jgi:hypothetical protein